MHSKTDQPNRPHVRPRHTQLLWLLLFILISLFLIIQLHPFLATTQPPHQGWLTIEGWIDDYSLKQAAKHYQAGSYYGVLCTGGPIETGHYLTSYRTYPEMTAARLQHLGIPHTSIRPIIAPQVQRDRTYAAALALRKYLDQHALTNQPIHLITIGPHARRSHLLFRRALGPDTPVGITALPDPDYPSNQWYAYSEGVRNVLSEAIAYLYAKININP